MGRRDTLTISSDFVVRAMNKLNFNKILLDLLFKYSYYLLMYNLLVSYQKNLKIKIYDDINSFGSGKSMSRALLKILNKA